MWIKQVVKNALYEKQNKLYAAELAKRQLSYHQWIVTKESGALAEARARLEIRPSDGSINDFVILVSDKSVTTDDYMVMVADRLLSDENIKLVYGDEDVMGPEGVRSDPWFKPAWSPDLLESFYYMGGLLAVRQSLYEETCKALGQYPKAVYDNKDKGIVTFGNTQCRFVKCRINICDSRFTNWLRAFVEAVGGYGERRSASVSHISYCLSHVYSLEDMKRPLERYMNREEDNSQRGYMKNCPKLSIVIPSKDNPDILQKCVEAIAGVAGEGENRLNPELIVVDNGSSRENRCRIESFLKGICPEDQGQVFNNISYLYNPQPFNFSTMCNAGAKAATGDILLFLNDDVELVLPGTLQTMMQKACRPYVGAVGLKLLYPDSTRIQHAGVYNLPIGPVHKLQFHDDRELIYYGSNRGCHDLTAVTAACLMVETAKFNEVGGFPEELQVAFNDIDLCFSLYEKGYMNVEVNDLFAYHHESLSRGDDESVDKMERLMAEREKLYSRHEALRQVDPYYPEGLSLLGLDTAMRPEAEMGIVKTEEFVPETEAIDLTQFRRDHCVHVRVEYYTDRELGGYAVVLGDNNACYDTRVVLLPEGISGEEGLPGTGVILFHPCPAYRPDLSDNMPDQTNVGLSGFRGLMGAEVPKGRYRVGVIAVNRVSGLKLYDLTNRYINI